MITKIVTRWKVYVVKAEGLVPSVLLTKLSFMFLIHTLSYACDRHFLFITCAI